MKRKLSAMDARQRFGEVLEGVYYRGDEVVIERAGKSMAVVVPIERYESMERSRERMFELIEKAQARNRDVPYDVIEQEVAKAVREVRAKKRRQITRPSR
ncbi:MAG: type II toxin-antitoxin system Phd/YefM family antitoxin [Dehalococcoidia bacterium]|nr:MAG: type II toxin-antitoxin system Phd/YefM family antitoxin [Dehalococcoidia bacterium]